MNPLRNAITRLLLPYGKMAFIDEIPFNGSLLDVGCGNDSPLVTKTRRPDIHYSGIDVGDYNQTTDVGHYADEYLVSSPEQFADAIAKYTACFDAVISSHNLEHCDQPDEVLAAMLQALKINGRLYLSFPSEASVDFPSRTGSLNFYDDKTHKNLPCYHDILAVIRRSGCEIEFSVQNYRPVLLRCLGFLLEPLGKLLKKNMPYNSTWSYYGFETVIRAKRVH